MPSYMSRARRSGPQPPVVSSVIVTPTADGAQIEWNVSPGAYGRLEYGTTIAYGSFTTAETNLLTYHLQTITGQSAGVVIYYRILTAVGRVGYIGSFTTVSATPSMYTPNLYGSGWAMDAKTNLPIGAGNNAKQSIRFIARTSSAINYVRWEIRRGDGSGYSGGTRGTIRISIKADDGTSNHRPTGADLASVDVAGNADNGNADGGYTIKSTFSSPYTVTAGVTYHLVFTNVDGSPTTNFVSLNYAWQQNGPESNSIGTRQPAFTNDFSVLTTDPDGFTSGTTFYETGFALTSYPKIDIAYADGSHDGSAYIQGSSANSGQYALITGTNSKVRELFTKSGGTVTATHVYVRVGKQSGTGDLTLTVKNAGGSSLATATVAAASVPSITLDTGNDNGNWVGGALSSSVTITDTAQYSLELSTPAGTQYSAVPMLSEDASSETMQSRSFSDGAAQKTTDGTNWSAIVSGGYAQNLQFYFVTS